jgi:hypothetical protein
MQLQRCAAHASEASDSVEYLQIRHVHDVHPDESPASAGARVDVVVSSLPLIQQE